MAKILLIGCGPSPTDQQRNIQFGQLRTWSIQKALQAAGYDVEVLYVDPKGTYGLNPFTAHPQKIKAHSQGFDLCVSTGPFYPPLVASWIDSTIPLWLDWPSDPLQISMPKKRLMGFL